MSNEDRAYNVKMVSSRFKKEVWVYDEPVARNYDQQRKKGLSRRTFDELLPAEKVQSLKKKYYNAQQQRWNITRLVDANFSGRHYRKRVEYTDKFLTLTFNTVIKINDIKTANYLFWLFVNRLRRYLDNQFHISLKYLASWEVQPHSKRIHYHIILFDFPYIPVKQLSRIWNNGYVFIEKIDKVSRDRRGSYIAKYLTKDIEEYGVQLHKVKRFFKSQNLKPINEKHFLIDRDAFDKDSAKGLAFESIYTQRRYDRLRQEWYSNKVHYYVYRDQYNLN